MSAQVNRPTAAGLLRVAPIILASLFLLSGPIASEDDATAAGEAADKMLEALGGRKAWAELRNTINGSVQNRASEPTVAYAVITKDFQTPRFRIETTAQDLHLIRVIDGDRSWRAALKALSVNVPLKGHMFARPDSSK